MIKKIVYKKVIVQGMALGLAVIQLLGTPMQVFAVNEDNSDVAEVDESGTVTVKSAGQAEITVSSEDMYDECIDTGIVSITEIILDKSEIMLQKGQSEQLEIKIQPADATEEAEIEWVSSDSNIVSVDKTGRITAEAAGKAVITARFGEFISDCEVTVSVPIEKIVLDKEKLTLKRNQTVKLDVSITPADTTDNTGVKWMSSNTSVATVNGNGLVTALGAGQVNIYAETENGVSSVPCQITVTSEEWYTGWKKVNGSWYYYDSAGNMKTGWQKISGEWYYLNSSGIMQTGWQRLSGGWYYLNNNGVMQTGWQKISGKWYYFDKNGVMQTGWQKISGKWYYLNNSGEMQTGWQKISGKWYYLNVSGAMETGWVKLGNTWYYLKSDGAMETGWMKLGGTWYYLKESGAMATGWLKLSGYWYYLGNSGAMATGWQKIGGVWYYFVSSGEMKTSGTSGPVTFKSGNVFQISKCEATSYSGSQMTITLEAARNNSLEKLSSTFYVVMLNSKGTELLDVTEGKVSQSGTFRISTSFTSDDSFRTMMMGKYAIAVKQGYSYEVISSSVFLNNPEITVSKDEGFKDQYWGYYEGYKITSKKGMQGVADAYTEDLRAQHLLLNVDMQDLVWTRPASGYVSYNYRGKTYYFSDLVALKKTIYDLHGWGSREGNAYGENHTRNVTVVLLMSWKYDELSYLIHPSARNKGKAPYYALNMQDENARQTFEALFCYLGEELGQMKERVNNWTLGNEVNSCNAWNYSGSMSLADCVENYAQAFQLLNQGIKRTADSPRLFISLDHCWNTADAGYTGKAFLDEFAANMNRTAPSMQWNINYHPYSQPLKNAAFWKDGSNTTNSVNTSYISMKNIGVLTDYLSALESKYGKTANSIRVIIGEIGFSAVGGNASEEQLQAAALGYGYYIAMFNKRIDAYIIRAYVDAGKEVSEGLYFGLRRNDSAQTAKQSYQVYKNLDTGQSLALMNQYLGLIGIDSWESAVSGFNGDALIVNSF